jgi:replication factor A1
MTRTSIDVTLWGLAAKRVGNELQQRYYLQDTTILVIKGGRVNEFNGKVINTTSNTHLMVNVQTPELE